MSPWNFGFRFKFQLVQLLVPFQTCKKEFSGIKLKI